MQYCRCGHFHLLNFVDGEKINYLLGNQKLPTFSQNLYWEEGLDEIQDQILAPKFLQKIVRLTRKIWPTTKTH